MNEHAGTILTLLRDGEGARQIESVYGELPDLAGAELKSLRLETAGKNFSPWGGRELILTIHYWRGACNAHPDAPRIYSESDRHRLIVLAFDDPEDVSFQGLSASNMTINSATWRRQDHGFAVKIDGAFQLRFDAFAIKLLAIEPCDEIGDISPNA